VWGVNRRRQLSQTYLAALPPKTSGAAAPVVKECAHLGVVVARGLDFSATVEGRCKKAQKVLCVTVPLLRAQSVPLALRVSVLRTPLSPTLLCGSEAWGTNESRCAKAQTTVSEALRAVVGCKVRGTTQPVAAFTEGNECGSYVRDSCGKEGEGCQEAPWSENVDWDV